MALRVHHNKDGATQMAIRSPGTIGSLASSGPSGGPTDPKRRLRIGTEASTQGSLARTRIQTEDFRLYLTSNECGLIVGWTRENCRDGSKNVWTFSGRLMEPYVVHHTEFVRIADRT
jgi:hypothetical protein